MKQLALAAALSLCVPAGAGGDLPRRLGSWVVYWDAERGMEMLKRHADELDEVSVFAAHFDEDYRLVPANGWVAQAPDSLLKKAPRVLLTAVNDVVSEGRSRLKDPDAVHAAVRTRAARARHVADLLELSAWADGVEIDYERIALEDREGFSLLIRELADALHRRGKTLSVVVEPKTSDVWKNGAGAVDWAAVGRAADAVKVMAYFDHHEKGPPGPPASPRWVVEVARFALTQIPPEKLWIALTVAGIDWPESGPGRQVEFAHVRKIRGRVRRDRASGTPRMRYLGPNGEKREVWFEDAKSIRIKRSRLASIGVRQVALWRLGVGDPDLWRD